MIFLVANIDEMRLVEEWKPMRGKYPNIAIELIDRLKLVTVSILLRFSSCILLLIL